MQHSPLSEHLPSIQDLTLRNCRFIQRNQDGRFSRTGIAPKYNNGFNLDLPFTKIKSLKIIISDHDVYSSVASAHIYVKLFSSNRPKSYYVYEHCSSVAKEIDHKRFKAARQLSKKQGFMMYLFVGSVDSLSFSAPRKGLDFTINFT